MMDSKLQPKVTINRSLPLLLVLTLMWACQVDAQQQGVVVEKKGKSFLLKDHSLIRGVSRDIVNALLTLGITKKDTGAISQLIAADTYNVRGMLQICDYLSRSGLERINNPEDELSLKDVVDWVLDHPNRRQRGAESYFPFLYSMGEEAVSKLCGGSGSV